MTVLLAYALAGDVYINNVRADVLPEVTLTNVTVRIDAKGDLYIEAPQYRVSAVPSAEPATAGVPKGTWWLVSEDHASIGQSLSVTVNGQAVYRVSSGQGQIVLDLGPYLRRGTNEVRIDPVANGTLGGGALDLYVGRGAVESGAIRIDQALVHYSRSAADPLGPRRYSIVVP